MDRDAAVGTRDNAATNGHLTHANGRPAHVRLGLLLLRSQPDGRLIALFQAGNDAAFEELVRRYRSQLVIYAARIVGAAEADDIVQEGLAAAYRVLRTEPIRELRAWLYTVVRNRALNDIAARRHCVEPLSDHAGLGDDPAQVVSTRARLTVLVERLRDLPARQRQALVKHEFEGLDYRTVADDLELSVSAAKQLVYRARSRLRDAAGMLLPPALLRAVATPGTELAGGALVKTGLAAGALTSLLTLGLSGHILKPGRTAPVPAGSVRLGALPRRVAGETAAIGTGFGGTAHAALAAARIGGAPLLPAGRSTANGAPSRMAGDRTDARATVSPHAQRPAEVATRQPGPTTPAEPWTGSFTPPEPGQSSGSNGARRSPSQPSTTMAPEAPASGSEQPQAAAAGGFGGGPNRAGSGGGGAGPRR